MRRALFGIKDARLAQDGLRRWDECRWKGLMLVVGWCGRVRAEDGFSDNCVKGSCKVDVVAYGRDFLRRRYCVTVDARCAAKEVDRPGRPPH